MRELMLRIYPVGAIYLSANATSPAELFGGEWARIEGKFLLAADTGHAAGSTGGNASVTSGGTALSTNNLPNAATYTWENTGAEKYGVGGVMSVSMTVPAGAWPITNGSVAASFGIASAPSGTPHAHTVDTMPPYLAVYVWQRVA